jgi:hypothetical protein
MILAGAAATRVRRENKKTEKAFPALRKPSRREVGDDASIRRVTTSSGGKAHA